MTAAGVTFAVGYASRSTWKVWTSAKIAEVRAAGIDPVFVFEDAASRALLGRAAGMSDGRFAAEQVAALGAPKLQPIYFAVDFDAAASQMPKILDYFRGVADALGTPRVGVYGGLPVIKAVMDARIAAYAWQTYAWSAGALDPRAHLYQYSNGHTIGGSGVDFCRAYAADFGQWPAHITILHDAPAPKPTPAPTPTPIAPEDTVTPQDKQDIADLVVTKLLATTIATVDESQANPKDPTGAWTYTVKDLLARVIRLLGIEHSNIRKTP